MKKVSISSNTNNPILEKAGHIHLDPAALRAERTSNRGSLSSSDGSSRSISVSSSGSQSTKIEAIGIRVASFWETFLTIVSFGYCNRATKVSFDRGHTFKWLQSASLSKYFFQVFKTTHLVTQEDKEAIKELQEHRTASKGPYDLDESVLQGFTEAARINNPTIANQDSVPTCIGNFLKVFVINVDATNQSKGNLPNLLKPIHDLEGKISSELPNTVSPEELDHKTRKNHVCCCANTVAKAWAQVFLSFDHVQVTTQHPSSRRSSTTSISPPPSPTPSRGSVKSQIEEAVASKAGDIAYAALKVAHASYEVLSAFNPAQWAGRFFTAVTG